MGLIVSLCLAACGGGDGDDAAAPTEPTTPTPTEPTTPTRPTATIAGKAVDGTTGLGVAGVTVRVGNLSATTAADGTFTLAGLAPAARVPVVFEAPTYAENGRIADLMADATTDVQARLVPVGTSAAVPVATGGSVTSGVAQVTLPSNGVQRADGSLPTGDITVQLTPIDPALDPALMPGDFMSSTSAGNVPIESFGALNVTLRDSMGAPLNLRSGQSATIRIPLASRNSDVPATIPLYYYNTTTGLWEQEGSATLVGSGVGAYYEGTVTHFSTWNADQVYNTVYVRGCVMDAAGVLVANAQVASDGIDYTGTSSVYTDAAGNFALPIRADSQATITAVAAGRLTNTVRNEPSTVDIAWTECLALSQVGAGGITMKLTWGALPGDLDSHLVTPSGEEIYYSSQGALTAAPFANLDVDDTDSYGPEVVTVTRLMVGTYKYTVHNYDGYSGGPIAQSGARVELNIPGRAVELITPPAAGESMDTDYWNLFEFDVSANCTITVRPVQTYTATMPSIPAPTAPLYCTP